MRLLTPPVKAKMSHIGVSRVVATPKAQPIEGGIQQGFGELHKGIVVGNGGSAVTNYDSWLVLYVRSWPKV
jgi:hypothetical protein